MTLNHPPKSAPRIRRRWIVLSLVVGLLMAAGGVIGMSQGSELAGPFCLVIGVVVAIPGSLLLYVERHKSSGGDPS